MNDSLVDEIITASKLIINNTTPLQQLIFIGQSPDYMTVLVSRYRNVVRVPFSGRAFNDINSIPSKKQLTTYYKLLDKLNIQKDKLLLIDHTHTGESIVCFSKILNRYLNHIDRYDSDINAVGKVFYHFNIISNLQEKGWIVKSNPKYINTIGYIIMPSLVDLANEKYPRTVPHYQYNKWDKMPSYEEPDINYNKLIKIIDEHIDKFKICESVHFKFRLNSYGNENTFKRLLFM